MGGRHILHNWRGVLWSLATATNRTQAGSSSSIHLPPPSGLVTTKRGTKARAARGFDCSCLEGKCVAIAVLAGCSVTLVTRADAKGSQEVGWLIKTQTCYAFSPPDNQFLNVPSGLCE